MEAGDPAAVGDGPGEDAALGADTAVSAPTRWYDVAAQVWRYAAPYITTPVIVLFLLPFVMFAFIYISGMVFYFYHKGEQVLKRLREAYEEQDIYRASRLIMATIWDVQGWIWFGYEVEGLDNIPQTGPAMVIYYHGALPVDYYYLVMKIILLKERVMHSVVDRFLFQIWGLKTFLKAFYCTPGSQDSCSEVLREGNLLGLSPGGVYEAQFGDQRYEVLWKERVGFAKVALRTRCPIVPVFTVNIREAFRSLPLFRRCFRWLYQRTRLPLVPLYGGLPVKLKTIVGEPIDYDPDNCSPEQLRDLCRDAIRDLIDSYQKRPGSFFRALRQRLCDDCIHPGMARVRGVRRGRRRRRRRADPGLGDNGVVTRLDGGDDSGHGGDAESEEGVDDATDEELVTSECSGGRENLHVE